MQRLIPIILLLALAGCGAHRGFLGGGSPRDRYEQSLRSAGLATSAMGRQWKEAGAASLRQAASVSLPYSEAGFFPPHAPWATGLRFSAARGQRLRISLSIRPDTGARLFAELFRYREGAAPVLIRALENLSDTLVYEPDEEDAVLLLRLQPELLAAVSYTLSITSGPSLAFPVQGGGAKDIGSIWGDPRDAGARRHKGIDIFGKRGTPVVAAAGGSVTRVGEGGLGGKVVWLRPAGGNISLYYAHLDSQLVRPGQTVEPGTVLGLMGNTGNARSTAPHLHFGIYGGGGALNPYHFVAGGSGPPPRITGRIGTADSLWRTTSRARLQSAPATDAEGPTLPSGSAVQLMAASGNHYRVRLPDGRSGWLRSAAVQPASGRLRQLKLRAETTVSFRPGPDEARVGAAPAGGFWSILAESNGWYYGELDGLRGWVRSEP